MEQWPSSLPQEFNANGFTYAPGDVVIRQDMDYGPAKTRRRTTSHVDVMSGNITITHDQWAILKDFYYITIGGGVDFFTVEHPIEHVPVNVRFLSVPSISGSRGVYFTVDMAWETEPV